MFTIHVSLFMQVHVLHCCGIGIVLQAYSPLGSPSRPSKTDTEPVVMEDPVIKEIAGRLDATPVQVSLALSHSEEKPYQGGVVMKGATSYIWFDLGLILLLV